MVFDRQGAVVHCYAKCHLHELDREHFTPGNAVALFEIDGVCATTVICHERRYPELVRLAVMAGARILFHPNAGMDSPAVSRRKRGGSDGIAARAFENAIYYVFANSVGPQGDGNGPLATRRSLRRTSGCFALPTTASKRSSWRTWICRKPRGFMRGVD